MVIIFGATGFIGLYTVKKLLEEGVKVIGTGRNDIVGEKIKAMGAEYVHLDITKKDDFEKLPTNEIDGVILLAGLLPANSTVELDKEENAADYFEVNEGIENKIYNSIFKCQNIEELQNEINNTNVLQKYENAYVNSNSVTIELTYEVLENIGTKEKIVF